MQHNVSKCKSKVHNHKNKLSKLHNDKSDPLKSSHCCVALTIGSQESTKTYKHFSVRQTCSKNIYLPLKGDGGSCKHNTAIQSPSGIVTTNRGKTEHSSGVVLWQHWRTLNQPFTANESFVCQKKCIRHLDDGDLGGIIKATQCGGFHVRRREPLVWRWDAAPSTRVVGTCRHYSYVYVWPMYGWADRWVGLSIELIDRSTNKPTHWLSTPESVWLTDRCLEGPFVFSALCCSCHIWAT